MAIETVIQFINSLITACKDLTGRTQEQYKVLIKWVGHSFAGTLVACTGFGKTRVGLEAIKLLRRNDPTRKVIVVVPSTPLRDQWRKLLIKANQATNTEVWIINSLSSEPTIHHCSLLVLDEIHRYAAETFSKVFGVVSYDYIIGLTATIERTDGKHELLKTYAPVIHEIPLHVARSRGWVAEYTIINCGLSLSDDDQEEYDLVYGKDSKLTKYMAMFEYDINMIIKCSFSNKPQLNASTNQWFDPLSVKIARKLGWVGNSAYTAKMVERENDLRPRGQKQNIWGNPHHMYHPDRIVGYAVQARRLIADRKNYINNHPLKALGIIDFYNSRKKKTIVFSETKLVAKMIKDAIGDEAVCYYTDMEPEFQTITMRKEFKTLKGMEKFVDKFPDRRFRRVEENGKFITLWEEKKSLGQKKTKEEAIRKITDNRYTINLIAAVRALNEGIDIPDLEEALIHSRDSVARTIVQRTGRVARLFKYKNGELKKPLIVNFYLKRTKDEDWLKKSMKQMPGIIWVDGIEELNSFVNKTEDDFAFIDELLN